MVKVKVPVAVPPVPVIEAVMVPALPLVVGSAVTVVLATPAKDNVRVLPAPPKVALLAPPLAEKPPVVEYVTGSANAGVTDMKARDASASMI
jgi:hypothetical protein